MFLLKTRHNAYNISGVVIDQPLYLKTLMSARGSGSPSFVSYSFFMKSEYIYEAMDAIHNSTNKMFLFFELLEKTLVIKVIATAKSKK